MKVLFIVMIFFVSSFAFAQLEEETQRQFELEDETVQIRDIEAEQKSAKEEAVKQEKLEVDRKRKLEVLKAKKTSVLEKSKIDLAGFRDRILTAEKKRANHEKEITKIEAELQSLRTQVAEKEAKAKSSEEMATEGRKQVEQKRIEKSDLLKRKDKAQFATTSTNQEIQKLKSEYGCLGTETKQLESHLKMVEQANADRQVARDKAQRELGVLKQRRSTADAALKARQGKK